MRSVPDYLSISSDHVVIEVQVAVPWLQDTLHYRHAFDMPGLREEFGPLPEIHDHLDLFRRRELMEKRSRSVEALSATMARSILDAMDRNRK